MNWALVFMICTRVCIPQYVELYSSKEACHAKLPAEKILSNDRAYCVPVAK